MKKKLSRLLIVTAVAALMAVSGIALAGCEKELNHDHIWGAWTTIKPVTCTENGIREHSCIDPNCSKTETEEIISTGHSYDNGVFFSTDCTKGGFLRRTCTVCGNVNETTEAEPREHEFEEKQVITPATCKETGESLFVCKGCQMEDRRVVAKTPHNWKILESKAATCNEEGFEKKECQNCHEVTKDPIEKLDHNWALESETKATCTTTGVQNFRCPNCGSTTFSETKALGHDMVLDKVQYPDFEHEGEEHYTCSRCEETETKTLPMLQDGQEIEFKVQLYRNNGQKYTGTAAKVSIKNQSGDTLAVGQYDTLKGGLMTAKIQVHKNETYNVTVENLPKGFSVEDNIQLTPAQPSKDVYLTAKPLDRTNITAYSEGSVVNDFEYTTTEGTKIKLSELLETHDFVYVDLFFVHCYFCDISFSAINQLYAKWKDTFAFVAIADVMDTRNKDLKAVQDYKTEMKMEFDVIYDKGQPVGKDASGRDLYMSELHNLSGYPYAFIIDKEGVLVRKHEGGYSGSANVADSVTAIDSYLTNIQSRFTIKTEKEEEAEQPSGLEMAMLRCDYLPVFHDEK